MNICGIFIACSGLVILGTMTVSSVSNSTLTPTAGCFTRNNDTHRLGGYRQSTIKSEDACKSACLRNQFCTSVDWNNLDEACFFATNATDPSKYCRPHITHWDLNRTCSSGPTTVISVNTTPTSQTPVTSTATNSSNTTFPSSTSGTAVILVFCIGGFIVITIIFIVVVALFVRKSTRNGSYTFSVSSSESREYIMTYMYTYQDLTTTQKLATPNDAEYAELQLQPTSEEFPQ